jgi:hypothetical protein
MTFILGVIVGAFAALLGLLLGPTTTETIEGPACSWMDDGPVRCGPTIINGLYQLPESGPVIVAKVDNGTVAPEYQEGYSVAIDAEGHVEIDETHSGITEHSTAEIGVDGLQNLLHKIDLVGFFYTLPLSSEFANADPPPGAGNSILSIQLTDGFWEVNGALLQDSNELATLEQAHYFVAVTVGLSDDDPMATPVAVA